MYGFCKFIVTFFRVMDFVVVYTLKEMNQFAKKKKERKKKSANRRVGHKKACPQGKTRTIAIICEKGLLLPSKLLFANRPHSVEI